ncbi:WD40/YVTN/BNR-like repeat-containing protein [Taibaiella koreensis]|uniref:WD40/YVTN/BNR-like repeat-containing protein n=1 Tax=Taibaiella koreensis TaxID=1268548 RepID=UPI000E59A0D1|nr:YCF48-related protein [Taibaiella koreensis]
MKYDFRILLLLCLLFSSCKKDRIKPTDTQQLTTHTEDDLNHILFLNDTLGFIAGGEKYFSSVLLRTTDGGLSWQPFTFTGDDSKAVYGLATNGRNVYGVGYSGKIYVYNDTSTDWRRIQSPNLEWLQQIVFADADNGFIVSGEGYRAGRLYRMDPAAHLTLIDTFEFQLEDILFANGQTGYTCGYGAVLKTANGGNSWALQDIHGDFFRSIACVGPDQVWVVGYNGTIVHTADGGGHWEKQRNGDNPLLKKYRLRAVCFKDSQTGYAAGDKGLLLKTTDGGKHWSEFERFTENDIKCMALRPDGSLWLAGAGGILFHIKD